MYTQLKDEEEKLLSSPNFMNVPAAIRELEKIEMIRQADGIYRLDHAVTANQKTILKAFGKFGFGYIIEGSSSHFFPIVVLFGMLYFLSGL